jgi:trimeric autotransporter adhesin
MRLLSFSRVRIAVVVLIATTLALAFGAEVGLAADFQSGNGDVCEGTVGTPNCSTWGSHVGGANNVAMGYQMMPNLFLGNSNVALDVGALEHDVEGSDNVAIGETALTLNTASNNVAVGHRALLSNTTGADNIASGVEALQANTTGSYNLANGTKALFSNETGQDNLAFGRLALFSNTVGIDNVASGTGALGSNTTASFNVAGGVEALNHNTTGWFNTAFGHRAGQNLTTGWHNVDIANAGVAAEEGTTRIGTEGTQTRAFVAGVYKKPVTTPACAVKVNAEGQLGCNPEENSTAIATFASRKAVPSGNCLAYTDIAPAGTGACPAKTTGWSTSTLLAGPTPASGATVSNLYCGLECGGERLRHRARRCDRQHDRGDAALLHGQLDNQKQLLELQRIGFCGGR